MRNIRAKLETLQLECTTNKEEGLSNNKTSGVRKAPLRGPVEEEYDTSPKWLKGSNPRASKHAPTDKLMPTIDGELLPVVEVRTVDGYQDAVGTYFRHIYRIKRQPKLWSGPAHVQLTHALRFFNIASRKLSNKAYRRVGHEIGTQGKIMEDPADLLKRAGASKAVAEKIVVDLLELELLQRQPNGVYHVLAKRLVVMAGDLPYPEETNEQGGTILPVQKSKRRRAPARPASPDYQKLLDEFQFASEELSEHFRELVERNAELEAENARMRPVFDMAHRVK